MSMDIEYFREYGLKKKGVTDGFPFGEDVIVFKVMNKIFMMIDFDTPFSINLKCDPELAVELREKYESVTAGYHMNKKHWNTVVVDGSISVNEIKRMIDHSYDIVADGLPIKLKKELEKL